MASRPNGSVSEYLSRDGTTLVTPKGMGDLLPPEAATRRELSRQILRRFELAGYDLVTTPVFEHADVVGRGNDSLENRDLMRFVEPESGEVAVLRPDITPQVARVVATRLSEHRPPVRLCYEGRVFRRQRGRARHHRQIAQAGVECVGLASPEGDVEVLALAIEALEAVGLSHFRVELGDIRIVQSVLERVPPTARAAVSEALGRKDATGLSALAHSHGLDRETARRLDALSRHYGELDVLASAEARFRWKQAREAVASLRAITRRLDTLGLVSRVGIDLGETRGLSYYTSTHFSVLAEGPGEELCSGGRYDGLLARFGAPAPAAGFALDIGHLQRSLGTKLAQRSGRALRVAVAGDEAAVGKLSSKLRAEGIVCATLPYADRGGVLAFARDWGYDAAVIARRGTFKLLRARDGSTRSLRRVGAAQIRKLAEAGPSAKG